MVVGVEGQWSFRRGGCLMIYQMPNVEAVKEAFPHANTRCVPLRGDAVKAMLSHVSQAAEYCRVPVGWTSSITTASQHSDMLQYEGMGVKLMKGEHGVDEAKCMLGRGGAAG
jgi:tRNA-dihydrouridine synthase